MGRIFQVLEFPVLNVGGGGEKDKSILYVRQVLMLIRVLNPVGEHRGVSSWTRQTPNPTCCLQTVGAEL